MHMGMHEVLYQYYWYQVRIPDCCCLAGEGRLVEAAAFMLYAYTLYLAGKGHLVQKLLLCEPTELHLLLWVGRERWVLVQLLRGVFVVLIRNMYICACSIVQRGCF